MRGKTAKRLRKRAYELSGVKSSRIVKITHRKTIKEKIGDKFKTHIINRITEKYASNSPRSIYKRLKKAWKETPRPQRKLDLLEI